MKHCAITVTGMILALAVLILAQAPEKMPAPSAELKRLASFLGKWTTDGEMKPGPFGPGGKFSGNSHIEWLPGGFFLVMHEESKGPMGDIKSLAVFGYDANKKVYTYNGFDSMGNAELYTGTVQGKTWTWTSDEHMGGQTMKGRFTMKVLSPTSYTMKFELSQDGTKWMTGMEGKPTKK